MRGTDSTFFFFNDTATTEIYTLSLHDALPICLNVLTHVLGKPYAAIIAAFEGSMARSASPSDSSSDNGVTGDVKYHLRSEEHTSELQSRQYLVCRLLLEKKKSPVTHVLSHFLV